MAKDKYSRERAWIRSKQAKGVSKTELLNCVGVFSNKKKSRVMSEKGLSDREYKKRYDFLANVYFLLNNENDKYSKI